MAESAIAVGAPAKAAGGAIERAINFLGFQVTWFSSVLGAAKGIPSLGVWVGASFVLLHVFRHAHPSREATLVASVALVGLCVDSVLGFFDFFRFPPGHSIIGLCPPWLVAIWAAFATTLGSSLGWLRGRPMVAALVGAVAGPVAYFGGARLGAIALDRDPLLTAGVLAVTWAVVTPALVALAARWGSATPDARDVRRTREGSR
ncbi:MAG: DUF2878 domain-containing protein [Myxococcales bacterium]|nr:DUF2878 domain-containing protein [Myxococcales bacterium]